MLNDRATVLVVDDDRLIAGFLNELLSEAGYDVRVVYTGQDALARLDTAERDEIDLVLLDVMLPDVDRYTVCRRLRSSPRTERLLVIMVTGRDKPAEKTLGLDLGADDYIAKPFHVREVLVRVRAVLRRRAAHPAQPDTAPRYRFGAWTLDVARRALTAMDGAERALTTAEFNLRARARQGHCLRRRLRGLPHRKGRAPLSHGPRRGGPPQLSAHRARVAGGRRSREVRAVPQPRLRSRRLLPRFGWQLAQPPR